MAFLTWLLSHYGPAAKIAYYLNNIGNGFGLEIILPFTAPYQIKMTAADLNGDNRQDLIAVGN